MKTTICRLSAMALVSLAGTAPAQPPAGITPEMISRQLPLEGAPLAIPGPYDVVSEPAYGMPTHIVFRPADLDAFPNQDTLPVMAWGNGGCAIDGTRYGDFLSTIASHGFLVMTTVAIEGERARGVPENMIAAFDWAESENARSGSPLAGKIATGQMSAMGQSLVYIPLLPSHRMRSTSSMDEAYCAALRARFDWGVESGS